MPAPSTTATAPRPWTFSTLGCAELDLPAVCALANEWGAGLLELRCLDDRLDLPAVFAETCGEPARLAETLAAHGQRIGLLDTSFLLIGSDAQAREELLKFVPWAEAAGVPFLRVFDGGQHGQAPTPAQQAEAVENVRWWRERRAAGGWGVDLLMETHTACITTAACLALQAELDRPLAILWDTHHTWRAGEKPGETWGALSPFVRHVHVKDSVHAASERVGHRYVPPGTGEFPWRELQTAWQQTPYEGPVSLEWERKWHPEIPPLVDALRSARAHGWL